MKQAIGWLCISAGGGLLLGLSPVLFLALSLASVGLALVTWPPFEEEKE